MTMYYHDAPDPVVITYRHLVSAGSLNASNPLRVVSLCDLDAAYAQFEAARLGIDCNQVPLAVQQWNGLIAISYAARAFGISRHETIESAREKCPHLQMVHVATYAEGAQRAEYNVDPKPETHKVSLDPYRRESRKVVAIFNQMCPLGAVEKASIDELYCDLTLAVRQLILQRFPHLARPPQDSPLGLDTPLPPPPEITWQDVGQTNRMPTEEAAQTAPSETTATDSHPRLEQAATWTDYALACGAELIFAIRNQVVSKLGYTMSAGIASNKTLAKLCASQKKPNGQTVMLPAAVPIFLKDLPFKKIRFLGGKLGDAIANQWESSTVGDLWSVSLAEMQDKFGDESRWVYEVLRGIDHSAVIERTANKTMLASKNVRPPIRSKDDARRWLSILSLELCVRLKEAREESPNLWPSTMVLRYLKAGETARSRQSNFPFVRDLAPANVMAVGERLWDEAVGEQLARGRDFPEIIVIALGFSGLEASEQGQRSIEGFFAGRGGPRAPTAANADATLASSAQQVAQDGPSSVPVSAPLSASALSPLEPAKKKQKLKRNGLETLFQRAAERQADFAPVNGAKDSSSLGAAGAGPHSATAAERGGADQDQSEDAQSAGQVQDERYWVCPECQQRISPRPCAPLADAGDPTSPADDADADLERRLSLARQDHEDYHFAVALQREASAALSPRGALPSSQAQAGGGGGASRGGGSGSGKGAGRGGAKSRGKAKSPGGNGGIQSFFKKG